MPGQKRRIKEGLKSLEKTTVKLAVKRDDLFFGAQGNTIRLGNPLAAAMEESM